MLGDLPTDLREMGKTMGPPPPWFTPFYSSQAEAELFSNRDYIFGGTNMSPKQGINLIEELKFNQEMPSKIPAVARRYTEIEPLSPFFRENRRKYGYGDWGVKKADIAMLIAIALVFIALK